MKEERIHPKARAEGSQGSTKRIGCLFGENVTFLNIGHSSKRQEIPLHCVRAFASLPRFAMVRLRGGFNFVRIRKQYLARSAQDDPLKLCMRLGSSRTSTPTSECVVVCFCVFRVFFDGRSKPPPYRTKEKCANIAFQKKSKPVGT